VSLCEEAGEEAGEGSNLPLLSNSVGYVEVLLRDDMCGIDAEWEIINKNSRVLSNEDH
jgi:hypothetical protein